MQDGLYGNSSRSSRAVKSAQVSVHSEASQSSQQESDLVSQKKRGRPAKFSTQASNYCTEMSQETANSQESITNEPNILIDSSVPEHSGPYQDFRDFDDIGDIGG